MVGHRTAVGAGDVADAAVAVGAGDGATLDRGLHLADGDVHHRMRHRAHRPAKLVGHRRVGQRARDRDRRWRGRRGGADRSSGGGEEQEGTGHGDNSDDSP